MTEYLSQCFLDEPFVEIGLKGMPVAGAFLVVEAAAGLDVLGVMGVAGL